MTKIYEALTVNFDHIFALTIFMVPKKRFNKNHLKRIIYLVAHEIKRHGLNYDSESEKDIINLISYEKFEPFEEILDIAIKDGIMEETQEEYVINKQALLNSYTHHTIRLKNILRVILNEILIIEKVKIHRNRTG